MPLVLLLLYSVLNMFRMLIHPSSGACDYFVELLHWLYLVRCVLVLRCSVAVVVWYPYAGWSLHMDTTPPQPHCNVTPTHIEPDTTNEVTQRNSRKLLRMDVFTSETCWALNKVIIKQVASSCSLFTQLFNRSSQYIHGIHWAFVLNIMQTICQQTLSYIPKISHEM